MVAAGARGAQPPLPLDDRLRADLAAIPDAHRALFETFPARNGLAADYRDELLVTRPEAHPSRALYGEYLAWCYDRAVAALPAGTRVIRHRSRAIGIERAGAGADDGAVAGAGADAAAVDRVDLADGTTVTADAVVIAAGWLPRGLSAAEQSFAAQVAADPALVWVAPGSPVEQDLTPVPDGAHAIVRGLGMGFFDTMALLTIGRGGRFVEDPEAVGGLRYEASGREPILHVTSRRGVPFRSKTLYGSLPPRTEQRMLLGVDWDRAPRPIDFDRAFWPRIVADAYLSYYTTLHRVRPEAFSAPFETVISGIEGAVAADAAGATPVSVPSGTAPLDTMAVALNALIAPSIPDPADRFDLLRDMHPAAERFDSPERYDAWVRDWVAEDLSEAEQGRESALKAGLWSVSTARAVANRVGTFGGFDAESRASGFAMLLAVGGMVGSGPPAFRNRQLLALVEAGLVHFIGPAARVSITSEGFTAESPTVDGSRVTTHVLIDAWMHFHDVAVTADPLAQSLLAAGRGRAFHIDARDGRRVATAGFDVDAATGRAVRADGSLDDSVHLAGIPVDDTLHDTVISPMPGTDPPMLRETDRVALSALTQAAAHAAQPHSEPQGAHRA
ncbi:FAD/NAD(P)-binding protein [Leucobacter rhizosphaerae]|uniref:FAD/NAD(P)-binding protein n=1 Tax=Leucobacter rhizosphaerae TaxID=2932245 RepID=UPI0021111FFB|nr:FAD/NAD(P)-binding protein [Leucobacter rhizosphaerae]